MKWDYDIERSPDFNRMPYRVPENAEYREAVPSHLENNPFYRALPGYRRVEEVIRIIESGNKTVPANLADLPNLARKEHIDLVDDAMFALRRHVALEEMLGATIRNSYVNRPIEVPLALGAVDVIAPESELKTRSDLQLGNMGSGSVGSGALFGDPGQGKTASLKRLLMSYPQIVRHGHFRGERLGVTQLTWLYISLPPKASTLALLVWITATIDFLLGTTYLKILENAPSLTLKARCVGRWLTIHAVGVIVCDELQNIKVGSDQERRLLENTLQELINWTYTRWVFVGTNAARAAIQSEALKRRMIGERGQKTWEPLLGDDWDEFVTRLWDWQVTLPHTPITDVIKIHLHVLSGGVPDYAKRIFTTAQSLVITSAGGNESLTTHILDAALKMLPDVEEKMIRERVRRERKSAMEQRKVPA